MEEILNMIVNIGLSTVLSAVFIWYVLEERKHRIQIEKEKIENDKITHALLSSLNKSIENQTTALRLVESKTDEQTNAIYSHSNQATTMYAEVKSDLREIKTIVHNCRK